MDESEFDRTSDKASLCDAGDLCRPGDGEHCGGTGICGSSRHRQPETLLWSEHHTGAGYDVFNILSQGVVPNYQELSYMEMRNRVRQDLFKNALWGRPIGYFWHVNELRPDEVANFMDALIQGGAQLESNTQMVNLLVVPSQ